MTQKKWIGLMIGFIGCLPIILTQDGLEELFSFSSFLSLPTLAIMAAALSSVYGWVLLRLLVKDRETEPLIANGASMLLGGLLALVHSFFIDSWNPIPVKAEHFSSFLSSTLLICFISNIICYNLYGRLLQRFTATLLSFVGLFSPIFASLSSWLILGETLQWPIFLSTAVVSLGMWIVYSEELRQGYTQKI